MAITFTSENKTSYSAAAFASSKGPLSALFGQTQTQNFLQYPSDLGSLSKGHMVVFTAMKTTPTGFLGIVDALFSGARSVIAGAVGYAGAGASGVNDFDQITHLDWQPPRTQMGDIVSLYMPDTVNFTSDVSYSDVSLKEAGEAGVNAATGGAAGSAVSAINSGGAALAGNKAGFAINPQLQLLFDGIDFRTYQMAFQFTPKNSRESETIKEIIKTFRIHAAPEIQEGAGGMAFIVPDSFIIQFIQLGSENKYVTKVKESVLTSVDVNYAPNGIWSAHADGSPTQINLTLQFKEIAMVDKIAIGRGF